MYNINFKINLTMGLLTLKTGTNIIKGIRLKSNETFFFIIIFDDIKLIMRFC